jgi:diguanylate cyclase (GGDEF)-like protein/PAS domain S-box-containing protein
MGSTETTFDRTSISRRLVLYIVACSSILTLLITALQLYWDYQTDISLFEKGFEQIEKVHLATITASLWTQDIEKLETIVKGISNLRDLSFIEIIENDRQLVSSQKKSVGQIIMRSYTLEFESRGEMVEIGQLNVAFDKQAVNQRIFDRALIILVSNLLKTTLVVLFMLILFYRLVGRHLTHISQFLMNQKIGTLSQPLQLERKSSSANKRDEFSLVVDSLNHQLAKFNSHLIDLKTTEEKLQASEERFKNFAEVASDWFWEMDENSKYTYNSARFFELSGLTPDGLYGFDRRKLIDENIEDLNSEKWRDHIRRIERREPFKYLEYQVRRADGGNLHVSLNGNPVYTSSGEFCGYRGTGTDITVQKIVEEKLNFQASHDALTGLINRREFEHRVNLVLSTIQTDQAKHAMCFLDLDQFKIINDTCGHIAGDELLRQLGKLLKDTIRSRDTLARLGGDEFGILMEHCPYDQAQRVAEKLLNTIREFHFHWETESYRIGVSIGLVEITESTGSFTELFKQADTACYLAKDLGRNRIQTYHPDHTELASRLGEMHWVRRIDYALENDQFCLCAQPIVALDSNDLTHYELLVRMQGEHDEIIPPGAFLPSAERYNLIEKIDAWVVNHACDFLADNPTFVNQINFVSINISGQSITNSEFLDVVLDNISQCGIAPNKICFEITETVAISNLQAATSFISTLQDIGCKFALDDFGSGLSSFGYLKNLPVDYLKIDGMFVKDIVEDPIDRAMVKSINEIGQLMGKQTIAEFVENDDIRGILETIGVDYGQGYGVGKPQPLRELMDKP